MSHQQPPGHPQGQPPQHVSQEAYGQPQAYGHPQGYGPTQGQWAPGQPPPKKKSKALLFVLGGFGLFMTCGIIGAMADKDSGSSQQSSSAKGGASASVAALPWMSTVIENCAAYKAAPNDIKKSDVFNRNQAHLTGVNVADARGTLTMLSTSQGGDELRLGIKVGDVEFKTGSLFYAINRGSPVYAAASEMTRGQCVIFSASNIKAASLMERSQVCDFEYLANISSLAPCQ